MLSGTWTAYDQFPKRLEARATATDHWPFTHSAPTLQCCAAGAS